MKKYVVTGGPGVGKSTVINILANRGYDVIPEMARETIEEEVGRDSDALPWKDLSKFQGIIAQKQLENERRAVGDEIFLDRCLIDGHAYCQQGQVATPEIILNEAKGRYDKIFLLDPLPKYETDSARKENAELQAIIHKATEDAYREFDYEIINVPVLDPEERVDFIIEQINNV